MTIKDLASSGGIPNLGSFLEEALRPVRRDFPGGPVVKTLSSNVGGVGSIPGRGTKIPHAVGAAKNLKRKKKRPARDRQKRTTDWGGHAYVNPILDRPKIIHSVFRGLSWFAGIPLLERSVLNLTIILQESWKATVAAIEEQQSALGSLTEVVLQNRRALML